jgi:hypothetical protein
MAYGSTSVLDLNVWIYYERQQRRSLFKRVRVKSLDASSGEIIAIGKGHP